MSSFRFAKLIHIFCFATLNIPLFSYADGAQGSIEAQIKTENDLWAEAYARGDYIEIANLYTKDGALFPPGEGRVVGPDAIASYFKNKSINTGPRTVAFNSFEFYGDDTSVTEISNTEIHDNVGNLVSRGRQTLVFLKKNGVWKLHRDIWNTDLPILCR